MFSSLSATVPARSTTAVSTTDEPCGVKLPVSVAVPLAPTFADLVSTGVPVVDSPSKKSTTALPLWLPLLRTISVMLTAWPGTASAGVVAKSASASERSARVSSTTKKVCSATLSSSLTSAIAPAGSSSRRTVCSPSGSDTLGTVSSSDAPGASGPRFPVGNVCTGTPATTRVSR